MFKLIYKYSDKCKKSKKFKKKFFLNYDQQYYLSN